MDETEINRILNNMAKGLPIDAGAEAQDSQNTQNSQSEISQDFENSQIEYTEYGEPTEEDIMKIRGIDGNNDEMRPVETGVENVQSLESFDIPYLDLRNGIDSLEPEDIMSMRDDPYEDDKLPDEFDMQEIGKFMYDDYIGRIPFSRNMPKNIYNEIFALEIHRKLANLKETKLNYKTKIKNTKEFLSFITKNYDFYTDKEIDLNEIIHFMKVRGFVIKDTSHFVDLKDGKFKPDISDYPLFQIPDDYSMDGIPDDVSPNDLRDAKNLIELSKKYTDLKQKGYVSEEGRFILDDMRPIREDDTPAYIRNSQWNSDADVEVWAGRMQVIKRQIDSKEEHLKKHPRNVLDEYPKPNTIDYKEEPHPYDERYVMINGKVAHAGVPKDSPYYPRYKDPDEHTIDEVWELEAKFADEILSLEEEIKELKRQFKDKREWYADQGVSVKAVERSVRRIKREKKKTPLEQRQEDEIYERLSKNTNLLERLNLLSA